MIDLDYCAVRRREYLPLDNGALPVDMPNEPNDRGSPWSSWLLVLLILILVGIALADVVPRPLAFLRNLGIL